jgi:hypothetical protein
VAENNLSAIANKENAGEKAQRFDYDGYYKDLIECFFYPLLKRAAPRLYEIADTVVKPRFLDKDFRDILNTGDPTIHTSPYFADFVVEVPTNTKLKSNVGEAAFARRSESVVRPTLSKARKNNEAYI